MAAVPGRASSDRINGEQAALRRVATLVARGTPPAEVFAAVTEEAGRLLDVSHATMGRFDSHGTVTVVAEWHSTRPSFPVGSRWRASGGDVPANVFRTGRPARIDYHSRIPDPGPVTDAARGFGLSAGVGVPVSVEGRLWGVIVVGSSSLPLPAGTEDRLAGFTELAATAIANAQARMELRGYAAEQASLRRVATLVAGAAAPAEVLTAVTEEAGRLLQADYATMKRYDPDDTVTVVATWKTAGAAYPVGAKARLGGHNVPTLIFQTHQPARVDDLAGASGAIGELGRQFGFRASAGAPVIVEGRLWGLMTVESRAGPLPADAEARLAGFTELAATAIANAEAQAALTASRARIVATADATRRRIERNLHDGAQQRLISLVMEVRDAQAAAPSGAGDQEQRLDHIANGLDDVLGELREIASGLHPAILADGGLRPALKTLARRSAIPVGLDIQVDGRLPEVVEIAAYYTVTEALTNAAKHARATAAEVLVTTHDGSLHVRVHDDGRGGADFGNGSGLVGLKDRAEALGGHLQLHSPPEAGTTLEIELPLAAGGPALSPEPRLPSDTAGRADRHHG